jgi:hypothetical protein
MANASPADAGRAHLPRSTFGWIGLLVPPAAWAAQLMSSWAFGEMIACAPATSATGEILGLDVNAFVAFVNAGLLAATVLAGVGAFAELRRVRGLPDPTPAGRATWLARVGVLSSALFAVLIAASFVPIGLIERCTEAG